MLTVEETKLDPQAFIRSRAEIFAVFDGRTQDSGNVSYGVSQGTERFFVKTAGKPENPRAHLARPERVALLRNAICLSRTFSHPALVPLRGVVESSAGPLLVYDWFEGELLRRARDDRAVSSAVRRFRELSLQQRLAALDLVFDLHREIASKGWVAVDFYDGALLYDFALQSLRVIDLDHYRDAPFENEMGRMFGSSRFMSPEEFELGARIDQRSNVFTLGRAGLWCLSEDPDALESFRGPSELLEVFQRACQPRPADRFSSVAAFYQAWGVARPEATGADSGAHSGG